jgi:wyosine [tRNA(Phe)-imidazoG37] synthetase (radical SAM superfamily)
MSEHSLTFGPIPSRRLGRSIGINNIPPKICSYGCIYCQIGRAIKMDDQRREYYTPEQVIEAVRNKVHKIQKAGEQIDYLTFVPDGESTLDVHLGKEIRELRKLGIPLAIITNSSTIDREEVRQELMELDLVSVKVDAVIPEIWRKINKPHRALKLDSILDGLRRFALEYKGRLITETMLIDQVNDSIENLKQTAGFIKTLDPAAAYISIPTRPPARKDVRPAGEETLNQAFQIFSSRISQVEMLMGYEGNAFAHSGDTENDILSITAVHPMREDAIQEFLDRDQKDWSLIRRLIEEGKLLETNFQGKKFYLRKIAKHQRMGEG